MSDISVALGPREPSIVSVYFSTDAGIMTAYTLLPVGRGELQMRSDSLPELINRFVSYNVDYRKQMPVLKHSFTLSNLDMV